MWYLIIALVVAVAAGVLFFWPRPAGGKTVFTAKFTPLEIARHFYRRSLTTAEEKVFKKGCPDDATINTVVSNRTIASCGFDEEMKVHLRVCVWCALRARAAWAKRGTGTCPMASLPSAGAVELDAADGFKQLASARRAAAAIAARYSSLLAEQFVEVAQAVLDTTTKRRRVHGKPNE